MFQTHDSICDLLVQAELLDNVQATAVLTNCAQKKITPGQYLSTEGGMSPGIVRAAILSRALAYDRLLPTDTAVQGLKLMDKEKVSFEAALETLGFRKPYFEHVKLVCNLLLHADCINKQDRDIVYEVCLLNQLPVVHVLVKRQVIPDLVGDVVLIVERLLSQDALSYDQAVQALALAKTKQMKADEALQSIGHSTKPSKNMRLGELLIAAETVSAADLLGAIEKATFDGKFMGEIIVNQRLVDPELLQAALVIQRRINDELVTPADGVSLLTIARRSLERTQKAAREAAEKAAKEAAEKAAKEKSDATS